MYIKEGNTISRILISLPEELLIQVDDYCKKNNYLRSEFIRYVLRAFINPDEVLGNQETKNEPA